MTTGLINACKKENVLYRRFITTRSLSADTKYKRYKNQLTYILRCCEKQHFSTLLEASRNNIKDTWKVINGLLNKKSCKRSYPANFINNGATVSGDVNIAEHFNQFFVGIGPTLAKRIPNCEKNVASFLGNRIEQSLFLNPVTDKEILDIVHNAKGKSSKGEDGINMCLVKKVIS